MLVILMVAVGVVLACAVGGWALAVIEAGIWDKEVLREPEKPVDFTGVRR